MEMNDTNKIKTGRSTFYVPRSMKKGFTIVEMVVVIFIIILITSGLYISTSRFGDNVVLTNLAYDISATIRKAQSFGLSTKSWKQNWQKDVQNPKQGFEAGYGIRFASDGSQQFVLFGEQDQNWHCGLSSEENPSGIAGCRNSGEYMSTYQISGRNTISKICADSHCFGTGSGQTGYLDIIFKRADPSQSTQAGPEPDAYFSTDTSIYPNNNYQSAEITLTTPGGFTKTIVVTSIGQIYVQ
jgi:type II secretory pathway pseudopilin PulG